MGGTWQGVTIVPLPTTVAHHAMAEADPTNSLVASGKAYVYVIGGQTLPTDVGGTSAIYMASVDPTSGAVGTWTQLTNRCLRRSWARRQPSTMGISMSQAA